MQWLQPDDNGDGIEHIMDVMEEGNQMIESDLKATSHGFINLEPFSNNTKVGNVDKSDSR